MARRLPIFDLDGTLLDTDDALAAPFVALGVPLHEVTFGHVIADECVRLGVDLEAYLDEYDTDRAQPFAGVDAMLRSIDRWAVCSNKHPRSGRAELARLGWQPEVALFSLDFNGPKHLRPVLDALHLTSDDVVFVGDTDHDRATAHAAGVPFGLAAWNGRAVAREGDAVLRTPGDVEAFCANAVSPR